MAYQRQLLTKIKKIIPIFLILILLLTLTYIWFQPQKTQDIIPLEQEPVVYSIDDGLRINNGKLDLDFKAELEDLWCLKLHEDASLYYDGDFLLLYEDFGEVRITSNGGFIYTGDAYYQILNREKTKKIWVAISQKQSVMKPSDDDLNF